MTPCETDFSQLERVYPCQNLQRPATIRIGLVQLATDYTLENDWHQLVGEEVELYSTRMPFCSELTPEKLCSMKEGIGKAATLVADGLELDVMAYGCTAASMLIGDEAISEQLTVTRPELPATNPWLAAKTALRHLNIKKLAVLTPYTSEVNKPLFQALEKEGFTIVAFGAFHLNKDTDIPSVDPESIQHALSNMLENTDADGIFLSCTNLKVMQQLGNFEQQFNVPFVSSNQALFWHALRLSGSQRCFDGYGQLLQAP
ncbi:maleate cis-trans isomerase family protein [Photobacterium minamisatsumaniensis]|uniref:maleate cis-trans isomerase family protein n=1 Tax=Photobacterium minamisatsumaniensis TaxID=2910233 RepID=UPI003D0F11EA